MQCLNQCTVPLVANSLNITTSVFKSNTTARIDCVANANLTGSSVVLCYNGSWSVLPKCNLYKCFPPNPRAHEIIEQSPVYRVNTSYEVSCVMGYTSNMSLLCNSSGEWEYLGKECRVVSCPTPPVVGNSVLTANSSHYVCNDTATYT